MPVEIKRARFAIKRFALNGARYILANVQDYDMALDMRLGHNFDMYYYNVYEPETTRFIRENIRPNDVFVDVGASNGYFSVIASNLGADVYSFEANPKVFRLLQYNAGKHGFSTFNMAISNTEGLTKFYVHKHSGCSSLYMGTGTREIINTVTARLDSIFKHIDIIKIDVEGADTDVLKGMGKLLDNKDLKVIVEFTPEKASFTGIDISSEFLNIFEGWNVKGADGRNMLCWRD